MREHQFLAATGNIDYTFERVRGVANMLFASTGFFIDKFRGAPATASSGCTATAMSSRRCSAAGEQIDIEPGGWLYKDPRVRMDTVIDKLSSGLFGAAGNLIVNRFTGPGRVGLQSMYLHMPTEE